MERYNELLTQIKLLPRWELEKLIKDLQTEQISNDISSLYSSINNIRNENEVLCPYCKGRHVIKKGFNKSNQKYKCKDLNLRY